MGGMKMPKFIKMKKIIPNKIGKKYFPIYDPIFGRRIHVLLNFEMKDYESWLNRRKIKDISLKNFDDFAGFSTTIETQGGQTELVIFQRRFNWAIKCQGTLIHEITHTVVKIFNHNNIPFTTETQEFFAHMISRIYEEVALKLLVKIK